MQKTLAAALAAAVVTTVPLARANQPSEFTTFKDGKYESVKVQEHEGFHLSEACFKTKTPKCQAWEATQKKVTASKSKIPLEGNPAARFCLDHEGLNRILIDKSNKQYDYCLFKDGSMVDAWDLYYHFNPKKVIK
jgi:hypothetical protein